MPHKDKLVAKDLVGLKRKLGLNPRQPLIKCPGYSGTKARKLDEEKGFEYHTRPGHVCKDCLCGNVAGFQTLHYGYGLCHVHEKKIPKDKRMSEAEKHMVAIQSRSPFMYRDAEAYEVEVVEKATKAKVQIDFTQEVDQARKLVKEVIDKVQNGESMTELANGQHVQISDKSRLELLSKLLYNVGRLGIDQWTVNRHNVITKEEFNVWLSKLHGIIRRYIQDPDEWTSFISDMRSINDPKTKEI